MPGLPPVVEMPEPRFTAGYDGGFFIRPIEAFESEFPFFLRINGRMQFRWSGFKRDVESFTDRAGNVIPVESRNSFEIERGRLEFRGFFHDPNLEYYINIDADTDDNHDAKFHDFWVNYVFSDALNVHVGKAKVPGSYEWYESSTLFRFADRSLSTTFFRADRSVGVWATGNLGRDVYYYAMIANGLRSTDLEPDEVDDIFTYSLMTWWDVLGEIGRGFSDLKYHRTLAARIGHTFMYGDENSPPDGRVLPEERWVRLSDGTRVTTTGALAPGVTVNGFDLYLYSVFLVAKYKGFSVNGELYFRWLQDFDTDGGPVPYSDFFTHGFYTDVGYMLIREKLELIGRISNIDGFFGDAWEYAGGVNWFFTGHKHKLTFDVTVLDGSPASSSSPNFEIGQDGLLVRLQYQAAF